MPKTTVKPKKNSSLRYVWVTRSFLDYRIPVFSAFDQLVEKNFFLIYSSEYIPKKVNSKIKEVLGERAIGLSGEWHVGPEDGKIKANSAYTLRINPKVFLLLYRLSPDLIIADGFFKWTLIALLYRVLFRKKLVVCYERTAHTERNAQGLRVLYRKLAIKFIDAMCCNGSLCKEYTTSLGMNPKKITTGNMAADTAGIQHAISKITSSTISEFKQKHSMNGIIYLYIGRMSLQKGVSHLLQEWRIASAEMKEQANLVLVGSGELDEMVKKNILNNSIKNVIFLGQFEYDDLPLVYAAADIFVIATLEDNWSLVVPEAMSAQLPILTSIYNGCWPELISHKENGWTFDPLQTGDLAKKIIASYSVSNKLTAMGACSERKIQHHTPYHAAQSILSACQTAVE